MNLNEGYNFAVKKYGQQIVDQMCRAGIQKNFINTACRFHIEDGVPIEQLQDDFKKWNRYVLNNPSYKDDNNYNKNLNAFKTYLEFKNEIKRAIDPYIYPNCLYNDGEISIGECKSYKDAKWFPIQNLAYPDNNNDFCICKKDDGYNMYRKYKEDGRRIFFIYDKSRSVNDAYKRVLMMCKDGNLYFWNNYDKPAGSTKDKESSIWNYINSLPREAQIVLSSIAEGEITESKTNKNMKKNVIKLNENTLRQIVAESVKKVLNESTENNPQECAYRLMVMLGEICREMQSGGETCSIEELNELYEYASVVNNYFEENGRL